MNSIIAEYESFKILIIVHSHHVYLLENFLLLIRKCFEIRYNKVR